MGQCSILLEGGGTHFSIYLHGCKAQITNRGGGELRGFIFQGRVIRAQCFIGGGKAAHFFREGVNLVHIMVIKGTYFESAQKRYLPSDHFLTIWQQIQSKQV